MQPFTYSAPRDLPEAMAAVAAEPSADYIAGGTDLLQLMKEHLRAPRSVVDITGLPLRGVTAEAEGLRIGALTTMNEAAEQRQVVQSYPLVAQALLASASPQLRNLATIGGNLLQRTRCLYFRDASTDCNKRRPGSGCAAMEGRNRGNAIFGGGSSCIATHASDLAVALAALDALVVSVGQKGERVTPVADFYRLPGEAPHLETVLEPGEMVTAVMLRGAPALSAYVKVRDRASFEWALVSAAVAMDVAEGVMARPRVAVGGVGTRPWRLPQVEQALAGGKLEEGVLAAAAERAADGAQPRGENAFKVTLVKRTVLRALKTATGVA